MYATKATNSGNGGIQTLNFINNVKDWKDKKIVISFYAKYENVVQGVNGWEKFNAGLYFQCRYTDGTTGWVYPSLPISCWY